ncbi:(R)-stereoselective amidase [Frondihabitans sp. 762G35]|uniref:nitrilase-related carbon-nitrogen hydrolase n=1 Tax=Frondihabitans sp. 762G35 TaxID=1446794 RepID=UPI000D2023B9|nr:nitrilase-related carbon-nitrogen hydrolase [Frondihabitans sp. 762G35]ARC56057.1 (R)-stereoselective amidase [Frondihabitans sp. 762G35]
MVRVAAVQLAPSVTEPSTNRARAVAAIEEALSGGADIVVLPELTTSGYVFETVDEVRAVAIRPDDELLAEWSRLAATRPRAVIVGGFAELGADGALYNSAAIVDGTGVRAVYRKAHLWDREKLFFTPGSEAPPVVETAHGLLGTMICFDLEFPEWTRIAALLGTEILAVPTNWPHMERPEGERVAEVQIGLATARINRMAIVCADRTGVERGVAWNEGTSVISADGWLVAEVGAGSGIAYADLDPALSRDKTLSDLSDAFGDRRTDLYERFTPHPGAR